jgi:predicted transcriptional regulator
MSTEDGTCDNPRCHCSPCACGIGCRCGTARLGGLERQVMDILWDSPGDLSPREVTDSLGDYALTTISTILDRLSRKGMVIRHQHDRFVRFSPTESRAGHTATVMREALAESSEPERAVEEFVRGASPKEIKVIRRLLSNERTRAAQR